MFSLRLDEIEDSTGSSVSPNSEYQGLNGYFCDEEEANMPLRLSPDYSFIFDPTDTDIIGEYIYSIAFYYAGVDNPAFIKEDFKIEVTDATDSSGSDETGGGAGGGAGTGTSVETSTGTSVGTTTDSTDYALIAFEDA